MMPHQTEAQALERARVAIRMQAMQHDEAQEELHRTGKIALFFPVMGSLPTKRKPTHPPPKKRPSPSK